MGKSQDKKQSKGDSKKKPATKTEDQQAPEGVKTQHQEMKFQFQNMTADHRVPRLTRRFHLDMRQISTAHRNKLSQRMHEIDRQFVCRKTREQREDMGTEFTGFSLLDVYAKSNPNKITLKYGNELQIKVHFSQNEDNQLNLDRQVTKNSEFSAPETNADEDAQEEKLLDEQKRFQQLHSQLQALQIKYSKTSEQISELYVRVCGDFDIVEKALQGQKVNEWTYLEDLALSKAQDTTEFQWLLRSKGMPEIEKRRKFLLGGEADANTSAQTAKPSTAAKNENQMDAEMDDDEEDAMADLHQEDFVGETITYI